MQKLVLPGETRKYFWCFEFRLLAINKSLCNYVQAQSYKIFNRHYIKSNDKISNYKLWLVVLQVKIRLRKLKLNFQRIIQSDKIETLRNKIKLDRKTDNDHLRHDKGFKWLLETNHPGMWLYGNKLLDVVPLII